MSDADTLDETLSGARHSALRPHHYVYGVAPCGGVHFGRTVLQALFDHWGGYEAAAEERDGIARSPLRLYII